MTEPLIIKCACGDPECKTQIYLDEADHHLMLKGPDGHEALLQTSPDHVDEMIRMLTLYKYKISREKNWRVVFYDANEKVLGDWVIENRTESEAEKEAIADMPEGTDDWTMTDAGLPAYYVIHSKIIFGDGGVGEIKTFAHQKDLLAGIEGLAEMADAIVDDSVRIFGPFYKE